MAEFTEFVIYHLLLLVAVFAVCFYLYFTSKFNYWKDRGIPYVQPLPFFGNMKDQYLVTKNLCDIFKEHYDQLPHCRYGGLFLGREPALLIKDPELVERILIKDFNHFYNRGFLVMQDTDPLKTNLFDLEGETWHYLRHKISPTFSTGKLKGMFDQICSCGEVLVKQIEQEIKAGKDIDSDPLMTSFALDVIATCTFGLQTNEDTVDNKMFRQMVAKVMMPSKLQMLRIIFLLYAPKVAEKLNIRMMSKETVDFFTKLVKDTLDYREKESVQRNDFLQLLMNLKKQEESGKVQLVKEDEKDDIINQVEQLAENTIENSEAQQKVLITESLIAAQAFAFLSAGSESISITLGYCFYCLSKNPEIQNRLCEEIDSVLERNKHNYSYQAIKDMTYMDQVVQETLRQYPVGSTLFRVCTKKYKVPDSDYVIEEGTQIIIPVYAIHNDPEIYKSPEEFNPSRFINNYRQNGAFLPFGDGPRICIGMRFAVLELKVVLARILSEYTVKLSTKTQVPFKYMPQHFFMKPESGLWFKFEKRLKLCNRTCPPAM